ncbi:MAG: hypothetical protein WAK10_08655 [Methanoregula sp.]
MSATQSAGTCIAFRTPRPEQIPRSKGRTLSAGDNISPEFTDKTNLEMLDRFGEQFRLNGIDVSQEEIYELRVFDQFLAHHVQPNGIYNVQCMLLWSEWVRAFRHQIEGFPKLIREKEFHCAITDKFGIGIVADGLRGKVFPGIRFVP